MHFPKAPCQGSHLFISIKPHEIEKAKQVCKTCPHLDPCLKYGVDSARSKRFEESVTVEGTYGGQVFLADFIHRRKRGVGGRKPKIEKPDTWVTDLPLPVEYIDVVAINGNSLRHHYDKAAKHDATIFGVELGPIVMPDGRVETTFTEEMIPYLLKEQAA